MYAKVLRPGAATPPQAQRSAVGGSLRFAQEVARHRCPEKGIVFGERIGTDPMLLLWTESVHNISQRPFR